MFEKSFETENDQCLSAGTPDLGQWTGFAEQAKEPDKRELVQAGR